MGRMYSVVFEAISISAIQDFFEVQPAAGKNIILHEVHITQDDNETSQQLPVTIKRLPATLTSGSGGGTPVASKMHPGDAACSATLERNNTTPATSNGTTEVIRRLGDNVLNGWHWVFTPETRPEFTNGSALIVKLETAPSSALTMSGEIVIEEQG